MTRTSFRSRLTAAPSLVLTAGLMGAIGIGAVARPDAVGAAPIAVAVAAESAPSTVALAGLPAIPAAAEVREERVKVAAAATELERLAALAPTLDRDVLRYALAARDEAVRDGQASRKHLLTVIDYSRPSTEERLWVFDTDASELLFHELVAHGKNTGENLARRFSNRENSLQTSLGTFVTADTYHGGNGYSLRLRGLDAGWNDNAMSRYIVVHGAPYVSKSVARSQGRIGRSWGCPALSQDAAPKVIDTIKGGSVIFSYYPDQGFLGSSRYLAAAGTVANTVKAAR
jgi:hypothetical protein